MQCRMFPMAAFALPLRARLRPMRVTKSPSCGCCAGWAAHVRDAGFELEARDMTDAALFARHD